MINTEITLPTEFLLAGPARFGRIGICVNKAGRNGYQSWRPFHLQIIELPTKIWQLSWIFDLKFSDTDKLEIIDQF